MSTRTYLKMNQTESKYVFSTTNNFITKQKKWKSLFSHAVNKTTHKITVK